MTNIMNWARPPKAHPFALLTENIHGNTQLHANELNIGFRYGDFDRRDLHCTVSGRN